MAKGIKGATRTVSLARNQAMDSDADLILTEVDMGTARNGLLILDLTATAGELDNLAVYTSATSNFLTSKTAAGTSDVCGLVQDTVNSVSEVTIASNVVTAGMDDTGTYIFDVTGLKRYVNIQYDPTTSDGSPAVEGLTAILVDLDLNQAPHATAETAY